MRKITKVYTQENQREPCLNWLAISCCAKRLANTGASAFRNSGCLACRGSAEMVLPGRVAAGAAAAGKVNESTCDVGGSSAGEADVSPAAAATGHGGDGREWRQPSPGARSRLDSARPPGGAAVTCQRRARANAARTTTNRWFRSFRTVGVRHLGASTFGCDASVAASAPVVGSARRSSGDGAERRPCESACVQP